MERDQIRGPIKTLTLGTTAPILTMMRTASLRMQQCHYYCVRSCKAAVHAVAHAPPGGPIRVKATGSDCAPASLPGGAGVFRRNAAAVASPSIAAALPPDPRSPSLYWAVCDCA
eukprot:scaffold625_cov420-Prasinococcus_capsulatus_cf.AAC.9